MIGNGTAWSMLASTVVAEVVALEVDLEDLDLGQRVAAAEVHRLLAELVRPADVLDLVNERGVLEPRR